MKKAIIIIISLIIVVTLSFYLVLNNYFNFVKNSDNASKSQLNFLNGTYNGGKYYISYQIEIQTRKFTNILQEDLTSSNKSATTLTFFIYERIV